MYGEREREREREKERTITPVVFRFKGAITVESDFLPSSHPQSTTLSNQLHLDRMKYFVWQVMFSQSRLLSCIYTECLCVYDISSVCQYRNFIFLHLSFISILSIRGKKFSKKLIMKGKGCSLGMQISIRVFFLFLFLHDYFSRRKRRTKNIRIQLHDIKS